jgi:hypothetical protein
MPSISKGRLAAGFIAGLAVATIGAADVLSQLRITVPQARQVVIGAVETGYVNYSVAASAFKAAPAGVRAQLAQGAVAWARSHTASPEFKNEYARIRNARKPSAPEFDGTPEQELQRRIDEQKQQLEKSRASLESMPPDVRKQVEEGLKQAEAAIRQFDSAQMRDIQLKGILSQREQRTKAYEAALQKWTAGFPENPEDVIARRLKAFLDMSGDVDYAAALQSRDGKMVFVNEADEAKPGEWKLCYRAGQEAVDAARAAATQWLQELESRR